MPEHNLGKILTNFKNLKVLVVGDSMLDRYTHGSITGKSPEADIPIISQHKTYDRPGGAANVAMNIRAMGATSVLCSMVGQDQEGDILYDLLGNANILIDGLIRSDRKTTLKHRIVSENGQLLRIDRETTKRIGPDEEKLLTKKIENVLSKIDLIIIQDYDKGIMTESLIEWITSQAITSNLHLAVDPKVNNFWSYKKATLFKPNLREVKEATKRKISGKDLNDLKKASDEIFKKLSPDHLLITLSEDGLYYQNKIGNGFINAHQRAVLDVSGAGDSVISAAGLALASGGTLEQISELANLAGGLACESQGATAIDFSRLEEECALLV